MSDCLLFSDQHESTLPFVFPLAASGNAGLSTLSPSGSSRGKDRGKSRKSIFAPARNTAGEVATPSRAPGKGNNWSWLNGKIYY